MVLLVVTLLSVNVSALPDKSVPVLLAAARGMNTTLRQNGSPDALPPVDKLVQAPPMYASRADVVEL
jgi:hypothetical protein